MAGRGYDQYRPAYLLGHKAALAPEYGAQSFEQVEELLQACWEQLHGTSLLGWHEVRDAARASWLQARSPLLPASQQDRLLSLSATAVLNAVLVVGRHAHKRLGQCITPMPQGLMGQVLARHFNASQTLVDDLERAIVLHGGVALPMRSSRGLLRQSFWEVWRGKGGGTHYLLDQAEACQYKWLKAYEAAEKEKMPRQLREILQRQALMLRGHMEAIHWLRGYIP